MRPRSDPPLVLVVDDYQDAREMYAEYLEYSGFKVCQARDGVEALEQAFLLTPDIVLMDLSLPRMDGWEATNRLKSDPRTCHIPIIALTGHTDKNANLKSVNCDALIIKPCMPDAVVSELRRVLDAG